jgi:hypothetical protein
MPLMDWALYNPSFFVFFKSAVRRLRKMRWQVNTLGAFLRRIAIDYVRYGYVWYAVREIPQGKEPQNVADRVCRYYSITASRVARERLKRQGKGNVVVVVYKRTLVLLATEGVHRFFDEDRPSDIRVSPLHLFGYSIGVKEAKPCVMIAPIRWKAIANQAHAIALHNQDKVRDYFERISPFKFPGILRQKKKLLHMVNLKRKRAGLPPIKIAPSPTDDLSG